MPIVEARFQSTCVACGETIYVGDPVVPTLIAAQQTLQSSARAKRWRHAGCVSEHDYPHDATTGTGMYVAEDGRRPDPPPDRSEHPDEHAT